jgi:epoxyqueuosine reductase QueG
MSVDQWLKQVIREFMRDPKENNLGDPFREPAFGDPLVGFGKGDDPLFQEMKEHVGPFHMTPLEIFQKSFPDEKVTAAELTVISWVLPQTEATKKDNRTQDFYPSERWVRARMFGEKVNDRLRAHVVETLQQRGIKAVAPVLSPFFKRVDSDKFVFASTWSERHVAFVAGLGTFGLCDGLITPLGKAMRLGSVVAKVDIPPSPRPYKDYREYCLFFSHGTCGKCISRCPVGALSEKGHDKRKCEAHLRPTIRDYAREKFGIDQAYGCGLCQTGVPCESKIPLVEEGK